MQMIRKILVMVAPDAIIIYNRLISKSDDVKKEMSELLDKLLLKFEDEKFYYTMSVLYYIARK